MRTNIQSVFIYFYKREVGGARGGRRRWRGGGCVACRRPGCARRARPARSAATRDALVAAARRLFAAQGFAEVPTDAIVAEAGVTRGALYHQFADKTALFDAVLGAVESDIAGRLAEDVAAAGITDPVDAMR